MDNIKPREWRVDCSIPKGPFAMAAEAKQALKTFAVESGFLLVVKNSHPQGISLLCSQGGAKRSHKAGGWVPDKPLRTPRTKKVGCNYEVSISRQRGSEPSWTAATVQDVHSGHHHLTVDTIGSLPSARNHLATAANLSPIIEGMYNSGSSTSAIWSNLHKEHAWITLKDIENAINFMKQRQLNGMSEIEALHAKLKTEAVVSGSVRDETNRLVHLWFAPNASRLLTQRYNAVLLMDCTYKTNKKMMPLLHVASVASTNDTFTVACCFLADETFESYAWAINTIQRCLPKPPSVVVVDHERALIVALEAQWPSCRVHLCAWHISKNIAANCMLKGMNHLAFEALMKGWHSIVYRSTTEAEFLDGWSALQADLLPPVFRSSEALPEPEPMLPERGPIHPWLDPVDEHTVQCLVQTLGYIEQNKISIRDRFAGYAVNKFMHFKHTTTSRAEGAHWTNLKVHLKKSRGSLLDVYDRIARSTDTRMNVIIDKLNRERVEVLTFPIAIFAPVLRGITHFALKYVHKQYLKAIHGQTSTCNGYSNFVLGLPCAHLIKARMANAASLEMTDFNPQWYKDRVEVDTEVVGVLESLRVEKSRGRPSHSRSTQRNPSQFEIVSQGRKEPRKCGQCGTPGHNKRRCTSGITKMLK